MIGQIVSTMFSIFPSWFAISVLGIFAIIIIFLAFKIVAAVLDAIPFL